MKQFKTLAVALFVLLSVQSNQSKAAVTLTASGPAGYMAFEMMMLPLGVGLYYTAGECRMSLCVDKVLALASLGIGLVLLDENTQELSFGEISEERANELGIAKAEREEFNSQLEEVNFLKDDLLIELSSLDSPTMEDANAMWEDRKDVLSENAYSALEKVRNSFVK